MIMQCVIPRPLQIAQFNIVVLKASKRRRGHSPSTPNPFAPRLFPVEIPENSYTQYKAYNS